MKRYLGLVAALVMFFCIAVPMSAEAEEEPKSPAQTGIRFTANNVNYFQNPAPYNYSSNPVIDYLNESTVATEICRGDDGAWYYHFWGGYIPAWQVTPDYGSPGQFYSEFFDSRGNVIRENSTLKTTDHLSGTIHNLGLEAITLDTLSIKIYGNNSSEPVTGGTVTPGTPWSYTITPGSGISSMVDFSKLEPGERYTMQIDADFTDHYYPSSKYTVSDHSFSETWTIPNIFIEQGQTSVTVRDLRVPTATMTYGEKYTLKGIIESTGAYLSAVSAYVYSASDTSYTTPRTGTYELVNTSSYSIKGSKLDNGCKFATLAEGDYVYVLRAEAGGQGFLLNTTAFTVVKPSYTVDYWSGDGSFNIDGQVSFHLQQSKAYGATIELLDDVPTQNHYNFQGWDTSESATTVRYHPGDIYSANANLNLYAVYDPEAYTITYDANGGPEAPPMQTFYYRDYPQITDTVPVWPGHTFKGWGLLPNVNWFDFSPGEGLNRGSYYLYAIWQKEHLYISTDGGTLGSLDGSGIIVCEDLLGRTWYGCYDGDALNLSKIVFDSPKPGHYLAGWDVYENGSWNPYQINDTITFDKNNRCNIRAKWTLIEYENRLTLPESLTVVEEEAFAGSLAEQVEFPEGIQRIGSRAFANCEELKLVKIPSASVEIAEDAFSGYPFMRFYAPAGGSVEEFANNHGFTFIAS